MPEKVTAWIQSDSSTQAAFQSEIDRLAEKYSTPTFEPHLTLVSGFMSEPAEFARSVEEIVSAVQLPTLACTRIGISTTPFQCVFARIQEAPELLELYLLLRDRLKTNEQGFFMPHVSLMYNVASIQERWNIASSIALPQQTYPAAKVVVATTPSVDPSTWQIYGEFQLATT